MPLYAVNKQRKMSGLLSVGGADPAPFDPSSVAGLSRDWNFADATKMYKEIAHTNVVTADGDTIGAILDTAGGTVYLTAPADNTTRPLYKTNIQNGLSVMRCDGSNDYIGNAAAITADASQTIFIVVKKRGALVGTAQKLLCLAPTMQVFTDSDNPSPTGYNYYGTDDGGDVYAIGGTPTDWNILAFKYTSAADLKVYINGGAAALSGNPHDDYATSTALTLGAMSDTTGPGDYDIGRVLVYSGALSDANLNIVFSGLGSLWNITVTPVS
jgi:hypothetical protein